MKDMKVVSGLDKGRREPAERAVRASVTFLAEPEPEQILCPLISVDDHAMEPFDLFETRMPADMLADAPKVVEDDDGVPYWVIADTAYPLITADGAVGRPQSEWNNCAQKQEDFRRGVWDPRARLADMDLCGIWGSLNFPSIAWGFAGSRLSQIPDERVGYRSVQAYNDWMTDEWCATDPLRYIPCQLTWLRDAELAAREVRRNAARGCHAVSFSENPEILGYPSIHTGYWDPFFAACEETETVINLHVGSSGRVTSPSSDSPQDVVVALFPLSGIAATVDWIFAKIPVRFPNIKIVLSEAGASWVPMVVERLGRAWRQVDAADASWSRSDPEPVEVLRRNFWYASIEDPAAYEQIDLVGPDKLMLECDYPHRDSTWPRVQSLLGEMLPADASPAMIRRICYLNAAELYHHPLPPDERLAASGIGLPTGDVVAASDGR